MINLMISREDMCIYSFDRETLRKAKIIIETENDKMDIVKSADFVCFMCGEIPIDLGKWLNKVVDKKIIPDDRGNQPVYMVTVYDSFAELYVTLKTEHGDMMNEKDLEKVRYEAVMNHLQKAGLLNKHNLVGRFKSKLCDMRNDFISDIQRVNFLNEEFLLGEITKENFILSLPFAPPENLLLIYDQVKDLDDDNFLTFINRVLDNMVRNEENKLNQYGSILEKIEKDGSSVFCMRDSILSNLLDTCKLILGRCLILSSSIYKYNRMYYLLAEGDVTSACVFSEYLFQEITVLEVSFLKEHGDLCLNEPFDVVRKYDI